MSLRPRYSLLTLLILTALVAGGVKLWYGPHHVVARPSENLEDEFTYTRDWRGDKIMHGPRVLRYHQNDGTLLRVQVNYYLHGTKTDQEQEIIAYSRGETGRSTIVKFQPAPLPPADETSFHAAIEREIAQIKEQGRKPALTRYEFVEGLEYRPLDAAATR